jgi:hypothetical protein
MQEGETMTEHALDQSATDATPYASITPEDFAPFSEDELRDLAQRCETAPADILKSLVEQSRIGSLLLPKFGSVEEVVRPLIAVWGGDDAEYAEAA